MHTDLSPHLHSEKCNEIIRLLQSCREEHQFSRLFGKCNSEYNKMVKCLKEERLERRQKNYEESLRKKERLKQLFKEDRERAKAQAS